MEVAVLLIENLMEQVMQLDLGIAAEFAKRSGTLRGSVGEFIESAKEIAR